RPPDTNNKVEAKIFVERHLLPARNRLTKVIVNSPPDNNDFKLEVEARGYQVYKGLWHLVKLEVEARGYQVYKVGDSSLANPFSLDSNTYNHSAGLIELIRNSGSEIIAEYSYNQPNLSDRFLKKKRSADDYESAPPNKHVRNPDQTAELDTSLISTNEAEVKSRKTRRPYITRDIAEEVLKKYQMRALAGKKLTYNDVDVFLPDYFKRFIANQPQDQDSEIKAVCFATELSINKSLTRCLNENPINMSNASNDLIYVPTLFDHFLYKNDILLQSMSESELNVEDTIVTMDLHHVDVSRIMDGFSKLVVGTKTILSWKAWTKKNTMVFYEALRKVLNFDVNWKEHETGLPIVIKIPQTLRELNSDLVHQIAELRKKFAEVQVENIEIKAENAKVNAENIKIKNMKPDLRRYFTNQGAELARTDTINSQNPINLQKLQYTMEQMIQSPGTPKQLVSDVPASVTPDITNSDIYQPICTERVSNEIRQRNRETNKA
ncbi:34407_t:CDS:10, partial [Gigaspora margarita]